MFIPRSRPRPTIRSFISKVTPRAVSSSLPTSPASPANPPHSSCALLGATSNAFSSKMCRPWIAPCERTNENRAAASLNSHIRTGALRVTTKPSALPGKHWYSILYVQVLMAIVMGILIGHFSPKTGLALKPLGDAFVALIRMMIAPVIFCVVVQGIASMTDLKKVGRVGIKALLYFEVVSTLALIVGILVAVFVHPGAGLNINPASLDPKTAAGYASRVKETGIIPFLLAIIPRTLVDAFSSGDVLQVLLVSILSGFAVALLGARGEPLTRGIGILTKAVFGIIRIIVRAAPFGALGGMAFTVASYGVASLSNLLKLIGTFYATSLIFVVIVLGAIADFAGFSI